MSARQAILSVVPPVTKTKGLSHSRRVPVRKDDRSTFVPRLLAGTDLPGASLHGADLPFADLTAANLRGANLYAADMTCAQLPMANLCEADLRQATLYGADLYGADLRNAALEGAWLGGADLCEANLAGSRLKHALYDADTRWPEGFDPIAHGARMVVLRPFSSL